LIRRATPSDTPVLLGLIREFCEIDLHPFDEEIIVRALAPLLVGDSLGVVWLIGEPADGYAVLTWGYSLESGGRDALLDEMYVRGRNRGMGGEALEELIADLGGRGIARVFLETEGQNDRARRFYGRHGFLEETSVWMCRTVD
jgi:GNAT superfamily N-acetyltransferase